MTVTASPAIALRDVSKTYGAARAIDHISLTIEPGQFVALVGTSGSGKTTLLKTINRLVEIDAGTITVDGHDVRAGPVAELRRGIGYVLQGVGLFPHLSVAANIAVVPRLLGWSRERCAARVAELLTMVDLDPALAPRLPATLSGGQQQRVGIARALAGRPRIVLLDEPFSALDPATREALASRYRALHDELRLTSVFVTHDMTEALLLADRLVVLSGGRIIADGTPTALLGGHADPRVEAMLAGPLRQATRLAALR